MNFRQNKKDALHQVQVILCDLRIPPMSGTVFLDRVTQPYPDTIQIVLSSHTGLTSLKYAINPG
ncbi:MAG: hypothetical protein H0V62_08415 [Gammaproteobacteria bacterium]|nr:hypothetical protein [Gammaproteobacteria bacterium]